MRLKTQNTHMASDPAPSPISTVIEPLVPCLLVHGRLDPQLLVLHRLHGAVGHAGTLHVPDRKADAETRTKSAYPIKLKPDS